MERLGLNREGYAGERIDAEATLRACVEAAMRLGWEVDYLAPEALGRRAFRRHSGEGRPAVYLSAGIHGDEPAGPLAVLRLLEEDVWPEANLHIVPVLNPVGLASGVRENADGADINRDYRRLATPEAEGHVAWLERQPGMDLTLLLHEDWESHGFYCYELIADGAPSLADAMVAAAAHHCPIDHSEFIDGRPLDRPGVIRPMAQLNLAERTDWPEALWLAAHGVRQNYTVEAPSDWPLGVRVAALTAAVRAAFEGRYGRPAAPMAAATAATS